MIDKNKNLTEIIVKTQEELDKIPIEFDGIIHIEFGTNIEPAIVTHDNSSVKVCGDFYATVYGNSSVDAYDNSFVIVSGNSYVKAYENSSVDAHDNSSVLAYDNSSVRAYGNSSIVAYGNSSVKAFGKSSIRAYGNSSVVTYDNSFVDVYDNSFVDAHGNSSVNAYENSSVKAYDSSSVRVYDNSSVVAHGNSSVLAYGNSSVKACGNTQVVRMSYNCNINVSGNARTVYMPMTIYEFCDFYEIKHDGIIGRFYTAVHKINNQYFSNYDNKLFEYNIGEKIVVNEVDSNSDDTCGNGITISHLNYAFDFGKCWDDIAILEMEVVLSSSNIINYKYGNGEILCKEAKVIREVPLDECGIHGKILAKRRNNN